MFPVPDISNGYNFKLPPEEDYADYRKNWHNDYKGCVVAEEWFYHGLKQDRLKPRENIDKNKALNAVAHCLSNWAFSHEDKIALCGYLIDQWFTY